MDPMACEEDRFVVAPAGSTGRWVVHRPIDLYGDGYVHTVLVELRDEPLSARGAVTFEGRSPENLRDFLVGLEEDWQGWPAVRSWTSMEGEMMLEASHDGRSSVRIAVTLRRPERTYDLDAWSARIVLTLEAGEELRQLADAATVVLRPSA
jgi:hypothetical protein